MHAIKNRDADIFRTADALVRIERAKYIREKIGPTAKFFVRALVTANASDMSDSAFRQLFTFLTFGNDDGTSIFPSHDTLAAIMGRSVRTSERATAELTERGWLQTKQARRGPAIRAVVIPNEKMAAITDEILEPSKLAVLNGSARPLNRQNWQSRTVNIGGRPTIATYKANHEGSCRRSDGSELIEQIGALAQPEAAGYRSTRASRKMIQP